MLARWLPWPDVEIETRLFFADGYLLWPRTLLPVLRGELEPGEHELTTLVYADSTGDTSTGDADQPSGVER